MPVYTLDIEEDYGFELIGISSHVHDYRLAWALNKQMGWMLSKQDDVELKSGRHLSSHPLFEFQHPVDMSLIALIGNKSESGSLLPELQQFDFVLKIEDMPHIIDDDFYKSLRKTPLIQTLMVIDADKIKSKQNLIYNNTTVRKTNKPLHEFKK